MKNKKEERKWFVSLGYSVFDGKRKIREVIVKKRMSRRDLAIFDLTRMFYEKQ